MKPGALYAPKAPEQKGLTPEGKSVPPPIEPAKAYAPAKRWGRPPSPLYPDDGKPRAEFEDKRPGFARLMTALKPRPPFQILIMSEESRLGREQIKTAYALMQLIRAGVRIFYYLEDRERTLDSPTDKIVMAVHGFADEMERDRARQRTHDAMLRKAKAGHVTGGIVFGYANREVLAETPGPDGRHRRLHVERVIDPTEATIVRQIFSRAAEGVSVRRIARELNDRGAPAPVPRRDGRSRSWAPSSVRAILVRPLYHGEIVWNQTRKRTAWGEKKPTPRAEGEQVHVKAPALQIVPEALWRTVQRRLETSRAAYVRDTAGHLWGRPPNAAESRYLLTGLAACGPCGGGLIVNSRVSGTRRVFTYTCSYFYHRGKAVCANGQAIPMELANGDVLTALRHRLLTPEAIEDTIQKAVARLQPAADVREAERVALRAELGQLEQELDRLALAIAKGGELPALLRALQSGERRRADLEAQLAAQESLSRTGALDPEVLRRSLRTRLDEWATFLGRNIVQARQILRKLLDDQRVVFWPEGKKAYRFTGQINLASLVVGVARSQAVVSPTGFEPVFPD